VASRHLARNKISSFGYNPTMLYLDANATEPLRSAARAAALAAMDASGNPSSIHAAGRAARRILESARDSLAAHFSARPENIVFTSGATEANALAIHALGQNRPQLIGATEHDAVRAAAASAHLIPVHADGTADLDALAALLAAYPNALVCLMAANNETGVLHDIAAAAALCEDAGALLHVDAAQAAPRALEDWLAFGAASIAISGHKAGGPAGAGALILAPAYAERLTPAIRGGGQESGRRGGTPALAAIAGMAAAFTEATDWPAIAARRDAIEAHAESLGAVIAGQGARRLPNTTCLAFPGLRADTQLIALDMAGIAVSAGSACSSGKVAASHVLTAMGFGALAGQAIRVSLPWNAPPDAAQKFNSAYAAIIARALRAAPGASTEAQHAI
jgi:cysteine desulfurase